jgi:hypothetical protein
MMLYRPSFVSLRVVSSSLLATLAVIISISGEANATSHLAGYDVVWSKSCTHEMNSASATYNDGKFPVDVDEGSFLVVNIKKAAGAPDRVRYWVAFNVYDGVPREAERTTDAPSYTFFTRVNQSGYLYIGCGDNLLAKDLVEVWATTHATTRISNGTALPEASTISSYPNPFNGSTAISYTIEKPANIMLTVSDVRGALVRTLSSDWNDVGVHSIEWDGTDDAGRPVASAAYILRLQAGQQSAVGVVSVVR